MILRIGREIRGILNGTIRLMHLVWGSGVVRIRVSIHFRGVSIVSMVILLSKHCFSAWRRWGKNGTVSVMLVRIRLIETTLLWWGWWGR